MSEYIRKEDARGAILNERAHYPDTGTSMDRTIGFGIDRARYAIVHLPPADVAPVVHLAWERGGISNLNRYCPNCKNRHIKGTPSNYCAKCGAKMDKEDGADAD